MSQKEVGMVQKSKGDVVELSTFVSNIFSCTDSYP